MGKIMKGRKYGGKWKEKEVEDESSLYRKDVEHLVGANNMVEFFKWMSGQGCPLMSDGTIGYFSWDVQRFIEDTLTWHTLDGRLIKIPDIEDKHLLNIRTHLEERIKRLNKQSSKKWLKKIKKEIKRRKL